MAFKGNSKKIYFNQIIEQSKFTLPFKAIVCAWKKKMFWGVFVVV